MFVGAITNGAVQKPASGSYRGRSRAALNAIWRALCAPGGSKRNGSLSPFRRGDLIMFRSDATVPPLRPPFRRTYPRTSAQGTPSTSCRWRAISSAPRSDGIESNPQHGMIRVPSAAARS